MFVSAEDHLERTIQWYPGHMASAMRRIGERMKIVDVVVEVVDARVPSAGANPALESLAGKRPRLRILTRGDLADREQTARWLSVFEAAGRRSIAVDARRSTSLRPAAFALEAIAQRIRGVARAMVVGIPNSGKSSVINGLLARSAARTEDRAGVTRQLQWFRLAPDVELMDTPGILVPKIATPEDQWKLAMVGAVPRERYDPQEVAQHFHRFLQTTSAKPTRVPNLETFAAARGFKRRGASIDYHNAAQSYISAFNEGKFGRITLEHAP